MRGRNFRILLGIFLFLAFLAHGQLLYDETNLDEAIKVENLAKGQENWYEMDERPILSRNLQRVSRPAETGQRFAMISNTNYSTFGLIVYHEIPNTFIQGEIFQVRGRLTSPATKNGTYISFNLIDKANPKSKFTFVSRLDIGAVEWKINIDTKNVLISDYNLALYTGLTGSFNPVPTYSVRAAFTENNKISRPPQPTECVLALSDNKLTFSWKPDTTSPIKKIVFSQNKKEIEFVLSNFHSSFELHPKDFESFSVGQVSIALSSAYSSTLGLAGRMSPFSVSCNHTFQAGPHNFSEWHPEIKIDKEIPWTVPVGTTIVIEGEASVILYNAMKIEEPQNVVGTYNLSTVNSLTLPPKTRFSRNLTLSKQGVYILQINANTGLAVLNRPIYVGTGMPFLPDFEDFLPHSYHQSQITALINAQPKTLQALRTSLLAMLNQKRASWGRQPLTLDSTLNSLAQNHSSDMIARNFFGHVNPSGNGPQERAKIANLGYGIGENVAKNIDLREAHERLCRSPGHLQNIVNPLYTRVGLGIAKDARGYLLITQNYAAPLPMAPPDVTEEQIEKFRCQVRDWISSSYPTTKEDPVLSNIIKAWLPIRGSQPLMNYTVHTAKYRAQHLSVSSLVVPYTGNGAKGLVKGKHFKLPDVSYLKFGIGAVEKEEGMIKVVVEYAK